MKRKVIVLSATLFMATIFCHAQLADSLKAHIDTAFSIMQNSLYSKKVNWKAERLTAYTTAKHVKTIEALFPIIAAAYKKLGDSHGWFQQYNDKLRLPPTDNRQPSEGMKKEWAKGPKIVTSIINGIAYLRIPGMHVYNQQQIDYCANWLADSIRSLAAKQPTAWIIDLRLNTGGNIVPMMSGLASFFNEGPVSYYLDKNGKEVSHAFIKNRNYIHEDTVQADIKILPPDLRKVKLAVIIGSGTGSSGEGVAFNLKYRDNTKVFGEATAGVANATSGYLFNDEQSYFLLTTAKLATKNKKTLPMVVTPHKKITHNDLFETLEKDKAVLAALAWLDRNRL